MLKVEDVLSLYTSKLEIAGVEVLSNTKGELVEIKVVYIPVTEEN